MYTQEENNRLSIAFYYPSLEHSGGIERVVIEQTRIFTEHGYTCILLTNKEVRFYSKSVHCQCEILPQDTAKRHSAWQVIIAANGIKYVILNSAVDPTVIQDIAAIRQCGAKVINTIHFSFPSPLLFNEAWESLRINMQVGLQCDAVATVNKLDAVWWGAMGCNAFPVRNPFTYYDHSGTPIDYNSHTIIWVGRAVLQKKPLEALEIIAKVSKQVPDAKLLMVGVGAGSFSEEIKRLGIEHNVEIIPPTNEIGRYYEQASLHLLTSITESFCLVVAEAKSYKIPTIMYEVPFIELVEDGKGVVIHKQSDIEGMANSIIDLFNNPNYLKQMGEQAFETLADFNDDKVVATWQTIFNSIESGERFQPDNSDAIQKIVLEIYSAWMNHCMQNQWKIDFFDNIQRATGHSAKGLIHGFNKNILDNLKKLKRRLR